MIDWKKQELSRRVNEIAIHLLKTLEYEEGDIISYDDLMARLEMWCKLSRPHVESCIGHNFHMLMDSDVVNHYFEFIGEGETKRTKILEDYVKGKTARQMGIHQIELNRTLRKFLRRLFNIESPKI